MWLLNQANQESRTVNQNDRSKETYLFLKIRIKNKVIKPSMNFGLCHNLNVFYYVIGLATTNCNSG